jgi:hypothetical protein
MCVNCVQEDVRKKLRDCDDTEQIIGVLLEEIRILKLKYDECVSSKPKGSSKPETKDKAQHKQEGEVNIRPNNSQQTVVNTKVLHSPVLPSNVDVPVIMDSNIILNQSKAVQTIVENDFKLSKGAIKNGTAVGDEKCARVGQNIDCKKQILL